MFTILTAIAMSLSVIVYSADVVLGEQSSRKNITIILHPINDPDDDIRNSFSEEFAELLRSNGYEK
jgi:hypothetical protein